MISEEIIKKQNCQKKSEELYTIKKKNNLYTILIFFRKISIIEADINIY